MLQEINAGLVGLRDQHNVSLLFACESGSRAWGIESPDSDYDVRFIYVHKLDWYLQLISDRDVIELMDMDGLLDFSGWDLCKALNLAGRSNPGLLEWLRSPIIYHVDRPFVTELRSIMERFSAKALMHHYISLAHTQVQKYWRLGEPVRLKKYLYAIRPLLAAEYMYRHDYEMPPLAFRTLAAEAILTIDEAAELDLLLEMKMKQTELDGAGRFPLLDKKIGAGIDPTGMYRYWANSAPSDGPSPRRLQDLFLRTVQRPSS